MAQLTLHAIQRDDQRPPQVYARLIRAGDWDEFVAVDIQADGVTVCLYVQDTDALRDMGAAIVAEANRLRPGRYVDDVESVGVGQ